MFENLGDIMVLVPVVLLTATVTWLIAERKVIRTVGAAYQQDISHAQESISALEERLGESHVRPVEDWMPRYDTPTSHAIAYQLKAS